MLLQADAALIPLKDNSVHCCVTSPPYWGLRRYSGEQDIGEFPNLGLEPTPEGHIERIVHIFKEVKRVLRDDGVVYLNYGDCYSSTTQGGTLEFGNPDFNVGRPSRQATKLPAKKAPIVQGNLMLMPHRVAIALQDDGWIVRNDLIWWKRNPMPESCAGWRFEGKPCDCAYERREELVALNEAKGIPRHRTATIKAGDVPPDPDCLRCNGTGKVGNPILKKGSWRHTRAHEYIFMLTKKMQYWCNQEAVREATLGLQNTGTEGAYHDHVDDGGRGQRIKTKLDNPSGRNPRTVLDVPTSPYKGAHYATFPPNLIAPLIRASCPRRACPECGQGWAAVVEKSNAYLDKLKRPNRYSLNYTEFSKYVSEKRKHLGFSRADVSEMVVGTRSGACWWWEIGGRPPNGTNYDKLKEVLELDDRFDFALLNTPAGWLMDEGEPLEIGKSKRGESVSMETSIINYRPTCECGHDEYVPGIILDPFIRSGTTGAVARELQRQWVGLDISMEYLDQQAKIRALNLTPSNALDELPLFNL